MREYHRIRDLREDKDMSQTQIAQMLGISQRSYSRYENAVSMIPTDILARIADIHNVSVDYLLERTDVTRRYPRGRAEQ
ncbi:MAG: helix-turn-helix transcriptional regulator [Eubacteriales bacterium]|nr:helix-turn-helix transcriptional regulator [Eubacteriales bacterium]